MSDSIVRPGFSETLWAGMPVNRPVAGWGIAFALGTAAGYASAAPLFFLALATVCWFAQLVFTSNGRRRSFTLMLAFFCLAAGWAGRAGVQYRETCARINAARGETFTLTVKVPDTVRVSRPKNRSPSCRFATGAFAFSDGFTAENTTLRVAFHCRKNDFSRRMPQPGETWRLTGRWLQWEYDRITFSTVSSQAECVFPADTRSAGYRLGRFRARLARNLALGIDDKKAGLLHTITLGNRQPLPYDLRQMLGSGGIIHIFAISGLHVGIVAGLFLVLLRAAHCSMRFRWVILFPVLAAYLVITGVPPSAARACLMAAICFAAPLFLRRADSASAFFITVITVLFLEPAWVFSVSAQLSFSVIAGLLLLVPPFNYFLFQRFGVLHNFEDMTHALAQRGATPFRVRLKRAALGLLSLTLAAWISSAPLSVYYFGKISVAGLFLNLLAPATALVVVWLCCVSAGAGFIAPAASMALNRLGAGLLEWLAWLAERICAWPGMVLECQPPPFIALLSIAAVAVFALWLRGLAFFARRDDPQNRDYRGLGRVFSQDDA